MFRGKPCYRCFVGDAFDADDCDTCAELGVLGALTGTVGNYAALLAIRAIVGIAPDASGTLHLLDGLNSTGGKSGFIATPAARFAAPLNFTICIGPEAIFVKLAEVRSLRDLESRRMSRRPLRADGAHDMAGSL